MREILIFSNFQIRLFLRDYKSALIGFLMPILSFVIFSNLFAGEGFGAAEIDIVSYLVPAFIFVIVINSILLMFGQYYAAYSDSGTLLKYKLLGLPDWKVTFSIFSGSIVFQLIAIFILVAVANLTQNVAIPFANFFSIIAAIVLINFFEYSLVLFLHSISKNASSYNSFSVILFNYQMFLGGLTFPPEIFPDFLLNVIKYANPIYYGLLMFRGIWVDGKSILSFSTEIIILVTVSIAFLLITYLINKRKEF